MSSLVSTLTHFKSLLQECGGMAVEAIHQPGNHPFYKDRLIAIRTTCDDILQEAIIKGMFPEPLTELDLLRRQYLGLSKELYSKKTDGSPAYEAEALSNILNHLLVKIKLLENTDPASLMLD